MTRGKAVNLAGIWSLLLSLVHLDTDHVLSCELPPGSQTLYVYSGAAPDPPPSYTSESSSLWMSLLLFLLSFRCHVSGEVVDYSCVYSGCLIGIEALFAFLYRQKKEYRVSFLSCQ